MAVQVGGSEGLSRVRFLVVGSQRSGTSVTQAILAGHPGIATPWDETEAGLFGRGYRAYTFGLEAYRERDLANRALFDALAGLHATESTVALGVKVALNSHDAAVAVVNSLREHHPEVRVIHVIREDLVAQFASLKRAQRTGTWHVRDGAGAESKDVKLRLSAAEFRDYAEDALLTRALIQVLGTERAVLEVSFEQALLTGGFDSSALFDFLQVEDLPVTWATMNKVAPPVEDYVENVPELREVLRALPLPTPGRVQAGARAAVVADVSAERTLRVACQRAFRWRSIGQEQCADDLADAVVARTVGSESELGDPELLALASSCEGRPIPAGAPASVREAIEAASDSQLADEFAARLAPADPGRALDLANLVWGFGGGAPRLLDALASRAVVLGIPATRLGRCLTLVEHAWERVGDPDLAERRLSTWRSTVGELPEFAVLDALVLWFRGEEGSARAALERIASGQGAAARRARQILVARS